MNTPAVLWVVGEPGVGKTTFCRKLLASYGPAGACADNWTQFGADCAAVGSWTGAKFDGGDTVPPSRILPALNVYAREHLGRSLVLFDGDKFASRTAVDFVRHTVRTNMVGRRLVCLHIVGPSSAASGRAMRVAAGAKPQNESWVRGRATKSSRFAERFAAVGAGEVITIDRDKGETWEL